MYYKSVYKIKNEVNLKEIPRWSHTNWQDFEKDSFNFFCHASEIGLK